MSKPTYWAIGAGIVLAIVWAIARKDAATKSPEAARNALAAKAEGDLASANGKQEMAIPAVATAGVAADGLPTSPASRGDAHEIDVSPGFEVLSKRANTMKDTDPIRPTVRRHEQLQDEPRDESWSGRMETALRIGIQDSLTAKGMDTQRVELPVVECRATGCEIQALAYPEDNHKEGIDLQMILPALVSGPLSTEFDGYPQMLMSSRPDGRTTVITHLTRRGK